MRGQDGFVLQRLLLLGLHGHGDNGHDPTTTVAPPVASCTKGVQWAYYALQQGTGSGKVPSVNPAHLREQSHEGIDSPGSTQHSNHSNTSPYRDTFSPDNIKGLAPFSTGWGKRLSIGKRSEERRVGKECRN